MDHYLTFNAKLVVVYSIFMDPLTISSANYSFLNYTPCIILLPSSTRTICIQAYSSNIDLFLLSMIINTLWFFIWCWNSIMFLKFIIRILSKRSNFFMICIAIHVSYFQILFLLQYADINLYIFLILLNLLLFVLLFFLYWSLYSLLGLFYTI